MPAIHEGKALPCICCKKDLPNITPNGNQPSGGIEFTTRGHYGSTVFDPMDGSTFLAINVCDECIVREAQAGSVLIGKVSTVTERSLRKWDGRE